MRYVSNMTNPIRVNRSGVCSGTAVNLSYMENARRDDNHKLIFVPLNRKEIPKFNSVGINISTQTSFVRLDKQNICDNSNVSEKTTKPLYSEEKTKASHLTGVNVLYYYLLPLIFFINLTIVHLYI